MPLLLEFKSMPYTAGISIVLNFTYSFQKPDGRSAYPEDSLLGLAYMSFS